MDDAFHEAVRRGRRGQLLGLAFLVVVVLVASVVGSGALSGDDPTEGASRIDGVVGTVQTTELLRGIPQDGLVLGDPDAPATVVEFLDVKCPVCQAFELEDGPDIVRDLVRTGRANLELRLLSNLGESGTTGRTAIHNLAARGRAWTLTELLFYNQGSERSEWVTPNLLRRIGRVAPELRGSTISTTPTAESRRLDAETEALRAKLDFGRGTPTVFVRPRGATDRASYRKVGLGGTGSKVDKIAAAVADVTR